ncbi:METK2 synthase, partial [Crotophaga sulcirostris]|nr:METK2 synthase [Crotophaga sulcirostris]
IAAAGEGWAGDGARAAGTLANREGALGASRELWALRKDGQEMEPMLQEPWPGREGALGASPASWELRKDGQEMEMLLQKPLARIWGRGRSPTTGSSLLSCGLVYSRDLDLKKPLYQRTAAYGHFGRDSFPWEVPKKLKY